MNFNQIFIGRNEQLDWIKHNLFSETSNICCSMRGLNGIGKTTLKNRIIDWFNSEKKEGRLSKTFVIEPKFVAIPEPENESYFKFWDNVFRRLSKEMTRERLESEAIDDDQITDILDAIQFVLNKRDSSNYEYMLPDIINDFFADLTKDMHIVMIVDEFDRASEAFPRKDSDNGFFQGLYDLSPKSVHNNLSIMLISRCRVGTIAHHMGSGSDFDAAFPSYDKLILHGFNDTEMEEYFSLYKQKLNYQISEDDKQRILFYCGRHPGMLMDVIRGASEQNKVNLDELLDNNDMIKTTWDRMRRLMRNEFVQRDAKITAISTFQQVFIGPAFDANIRDQLDRLYDLGFVQKWQENFSQKPVPVSISGEAFTCKYEPISEGFRKAVEQNEEWDQRNVLSRMLSDVEKRLRSELLKLITNIKGEDDLYDGITDTGVSPNGIFWKSLVNNAQKNNAVARGITYSYLDILNFHDYATIILYYWDRGNARSILPSYSSSPTGRQDLRRDFAFLCECRNDSAHVMYILDETSKSKLKGLCKRILDDLSSSHTRSITLTSKVLQNSPNTNTQVKEQQNSRIVENSPQTVVNTVPIGHCVGRILELKLLTKVKQTIVGYVSFQGQSIKTIIPLEKCGNIVSGVLPKSTSVKIISYDETQNQCIGEILDSGRK